MEAQAFPAFAGPAPHAHPPLSLRSSGSAPLWCGSPSWERSHHLPSVHPRSRVLCTWELQQGTASAVTLPPFLAVKSRGHSTPVLIPLNKRKSLYVQLEGCRFDLSKRKRVRGAQDNGSGRRSHPGMSGAASHLLRSHPLQE